MPKPGYIHRRSGPVNWSSHTTIASESNLAQPYTSRASCPIALPKMLCWRDDWHSFMASAACAEASRVRNVDVIAMWHAARPKCPLWHLRCCLGEFPEEGGERKDVLMGKKGVREEIGRTCSKRPSWWRRYHCAWVVRARQVHHRCNHRRFTMPHGAAWE